MLNAKVAELDPLKQQIQSLKLSSNANKENQVKLLDLNEQVNSLREEIAKAKKEKEFMAKERDDVKNILNLSNKSSENEITALNKQLDEANQKLHISQLKIDELTSQLAELQSERANHQKLIKEHSKLESRFDKVRTELLKYRNVNRSSDTSANINVDIIESLLEDYDNEKVKITDTTTNATPAVKSVSAPQLKVNNTIEEAAKTDNYEHDYDIIKSQELELENHRLRDDLNRLRRLYDDNESEVAISHEIKSQFNALNEELQRRRDECIHLKTILVNQSRTLQSNQSYFHTLRF